VCGDVRSKKDRLKVLSALHKPFNEIGLSPAVSGVIDFEQQRFVNRNELRMRTTGQ
jgi:hypothetical protein